MAWTDKTHTGQEIARAEQERYDLETMERYAALMQRYRQHALLYAADDSWAAAARLAMQRHQSALLDKEGF